MNATTWILSAVLAWASRVSAEPGIPEYACHVLASAPVVDGQLDEEVWRTLPEASGFYTRGGQRFALSKGTFFRAGWTGDSLYLAIRCVEPLTSRMKASPVDGDSLWADDSMEVFIATHERDRYRQFIANSVGARWNAMGPEIRDTKPWGWEAQGGIWERGWQLELRIPFSVLETTPRAGEVWPVNIGRNSTTGPAVEDATCWPPLKTGFNDMERFGRFLFRADTLSASAAAEESRRLSEPFHQFLKDQCREKSNTADQPELHEALDHPALAKEAAPLKYVMNRLAMLGERRDAAPMEMGVLLSTHRDLMAIFSAKANVMQVPLTPIPRRALTIDTRARDVRDVRFTVNGREQPEGDGRQQTLTLREGISVIGATVVPDGKEPGIRIRIQGHPETDGRWRVGSPRDDSWKEAGFDDRAWEIAEEDAQGYLRSPEGSAGPVCFRQLVLWSEQHHSGLPCLQPKVREWGFSEKSMETLFHVLYSPPPLTFALEDYVFELELPRAFRLLGEQRAGDGQGGTFTRRPCNVQVEETTRDRMPYTRYRLAYESAFVQTNKTQCSLIPIWLEDYPGTNKECKFHYRRLASGNLTELTQTLPVRVLPPINGRLMKNVQLSQYNPFPGEWFSGAGPEFLRTHVSQSLDAGFNHWTLGAWASIYEHQKTGYDLVVERGGNVALMYNGYPLSGVVDHFKGTNGALGLLMKAAPEMPARFFNDSTNWAGWKHTTARNQYCPSFVTGAGAKRFKDAVKHDIGMMLHGGTAWGCGGLPEATHFWADWEETPWVEAGMGYRSARTGNGSYCFCPACKKAFRAYLRLPETEELSDDAIWKKYKLEWSSFRYALDGRINGLVRDACRELGLQYVFYTGVHDQECWKACAGKIDIAFPGCPGDGRADAAQQPSLDRVMTFFREEAEMPRVLGQLFASNYGGGLAVPWRPWTVGAAPDGFLCPRNVKSQILRLVASFHGGVDLNCSLERCAGMLYYIGEATRLIDEHEDLFWDGERADDLAMSDQIQYPNLLVLRKGRERLVLLFNEGDSTLSVLLRNKGITPGQKGTIVGVPGVCDNPGKMRLSVGPGDVTVVHIHP